MTQRTLPQLRLRPSTRLEGWLVAGTLTILVSLSLADRLAAWLIGEFPTSALLWQARFEYLRPIAVYYEYVAMAFGSVSPALFGAGLIAASILVAAGTQSRVRLVRALCWHALLAAAVILGVCSAELPNDMHAPVGVQSLPYAMLATILALPLTVKCLRVHAEFLARTEPRVPAAAWPVWTAAKEFVRSAASGSLGAPQPAPVPLSRRNGNRR